MMRSVLALMLALAPVSTAYAADAPAPASNDLDARKAVAGKLMVAMGFEQQFDAMIPQIVGMIMPLLSSGNVGKEAQIRTILFEEMTESFRGRRKDFVESAQSVYARNFTKSELDDMLTFYNSPTGKVVAAKSPTIALESMQGGADVGRRAAEDAMPRIIGRMQAAKLEVPKGT